MTAHRVVLDVGKTVSKLTLWSEAGTLVERRTRPNVLIETGLYRALDADGIADWLVGTLRDFAGLAEIEAILPVGHGAAAAILRDGQLACPPLDYEQPWSAAERERYDAQRDPFSATGSPALPAGLNLGAQLHYLERLDPDLLDGATILTWPQYWAWALSGVTASEITSLGCHSDLWRPLEGRPSQLAWTRGWAGHMPPLRRADEVLGTIRPELAARTGLSGGVKVYCGLHDSNAALLAARAFPEIGNAEATVLSTGTWFVAMHTPAAGALVDIARLDEARDCLVNVDVFGRVIPSARFMGGRESEILTGIDTRAVDITPDQPQLIAAADALIRSGTMVLPAFVRGCGPFPQAHGRWINEPDDASARRAAVALYLALVTDASLSLVGARDRLLIEGRFAESELFVRALASLRPDTRVYVANAHNDVSFGALRLIDPTLAPDSSLRRVEPLALDLTDYRALWKAWTTQLGQAA